MLTEITKESPVLITPLLFELEAPSPQNSQ